MRVEMAMTTHKGRAPGRPAIIGAIVICVASALYVIVSGPCALFSNVIIGGDERCRVVDIVVNESRAKALVFARRWAGLSSTDGVFLVEHVATEPLCSLASGQLLSRLDDAIPILRWNIGYVRSVAWAQDRIVVRLGQHEVPAGLPSFVEGIIVSWVPAAK